MRYMCIVSSPETAGNGHPPTNPKLFEAIGTLSEQMTKAGILLENGGLMPTVTGAKIKSSGGKLVVKDGPFTEAKEVIGGFAILQVKSKEEAIEHGKRFMQIHLDVLGRDYQFAMELRQMFDPADCAEAVQG